MNGMNFDLFFWPCFFLAAVSASAVAARRVVVLACTGLRANTCMNGTYTPAQNTSPLTFLLLQKDTKPVIAAVEELRQRCTEDQAVLQNLAGQVEALRASANNDHLLRELQSDVATVKALLLKRRWAAVPKGGKIDHQI